MLQSMGLQRVGHDLVTEQQCIPSTYLFISGSLYFFDHFHQIPPSYQPLPLVTKNLVLLICVCFFKLYLTSNTILVLVHNVMIFLCISK